jgi:hypothetical protein
VVDDAGVIIDTDKSGKARGFEFLNVRSAGVPLATLPEEVANGIRRFIVSGSLESKEPVQVEY